MLWWLLGARYKKRIVLVGFSVLVRVRVRIEAKEYKVCKVLVL